MSDNNSEIYRISRIVVLTLYIILVLVYLTNEFFVDYFPPTAIIRLLSPCAGIGLIVYYLGVLCFLAFKKDGCVRIWLAIFPLFVILGFLLLCADWLNANFDYSLVDLYTAWHYFGYIFYNQYTLYSLLVSFVVAYLLRRNGKYVSKFLLITINLVMLFVVTCPIKHYNAKKVGYAYAIPQCGLFVRPTQEKGTLKVEISRAPSFDDPLVLIYNDKRNDYIHIDIYDDNKYHSLDKVNIQSLGDFTPLGSRPSEHPICEIFISEKKWISACRDAPYRSSVRLRRIK